MIWIKGQHPMKIVFVLIGITIALFSEPLTGFFGYDDLLETKDENNTIDEKSINDIEKKRLLQKAINNPRTLSAKEFESALTYAKSRAVMQQTEEDIKNWTILNNFTLQNAESFQHKQRVVLLKNPELDISGEFAQSGFSQKSKTKAAYENQLKLIKNLTNEIVLFAFFGKEASTIKSSQERVLYFLKSDFPKLTIIQVDILENDDLYRELKEKNTPSVWLAYRDKQDKAHWYRVTGGLSTKKEIVDNIEFIYRNVIEKEFIDE